MQSPSGCALAAYRVADFKSESVAGVDQNRSPTSDWNQRPTSFRNQWPTCVGISSMRGTDFPDQ